MRTNLKTKSKTVEQEGWEELGLLSKQTHRGTDQIVDMGAWAGESKDRPRRDTQTNREKTEDRGESKDTRSPDWKGGDRHQGLEPLINNPTRGDLYCYR